MIIYTCITNGYDEIPDHYYDPDVQYVCLTDGTIEKKGPWEFRDILFEHEDPVRLSTHQNKIHTFTFLWDQKQFGLTGVIV